MTHKTSMEEVMEKIRPHLQDHLKRIAKDMGVTERAWAILEQLKGGELEKALHPRNFTQMLKENAYKNKLYHWGSGLHASNQLYRVETKVAQQEGNTLPANMREVVAEVYRVHKDYIKYNGHRMEMMKINNPEEFIPNKGSIDLSTSDNLLRNI